MPNWLGKTDVPLFVSHRRLKDRKTLPQAIGPWALDSGGFTELSMFGEWRTTGLEYVAAVARYQTMIGRLEWAAPQDWMCEPFMLTKTGLTVTEHQRRTVDNYRYLRDIAPHLPIVPVLQGWQVDDYLRCADMYEAAGVDLAAAPVVGVGSVCRRQATGEIEMVFLGLGKLGLALHGFGVKTDGLTRYADQVASADSMAWSYTARNRPPLAGCMHRSCANCLRFALRWRSRILTRCGHQQMRLEVA